MTIQDVIQAIQVYNARIAELNQEFAIKQKQALDARVKPEIAEAWFAQATQEIDEALLALINRYIDAPLLQAKAANRGVVTSVAHAQRLQAIEEVLIEVGKHKKNNHVAGVILYTLPSLGGFHNLPLFRPFLTMPVNDKQGAIIRLKKQEKPLSELAPFIEAIMKVMKQQTLREKGKWLFKPGKILTQEELLGTLQKGIPPATLSPYRRALGLPESAILEDMFVKMHQIAADMQPKLSDEQQTIALQFYQLVDYLKESNNITFSRAGDFRYVIQPSDTPLMNEISLAVTGVLNDLLHSPEAQVYAMTEAMDSIRGLIESRPAIVAEGATASKYNVAAPVSFNRGGRDSSSPTGKVDGIQEILKLKVSRDFKML